MVWTHGDVGRGSLPRCIRVCVLFLRFRPVEDDGNLVEDVGDAVTKSKMVFHFMESAAVRGGMGRRGHLVRVRNLHLVEGPRELGAVREGRRRWPFERVWSLDRDAQFLELVELREERCVKPQLCAAAKPQLLQVGQPFEARGEPAERAAAVGRQVIKRAHGAEARRQRDERRAQVDGEPLQERQRPKALRQVAQEVAAGELQLAQRVQLAERLGEPLQRKAPVEMERTQLSQAAEIVGQCVHAAA